MNGLRFRDLFKLAGWLLLHLLCLAPLFLVYWLIGDTEVYEKSWLWSLAGVAALLVLAREKGHAPLVLGLCSIAFWLKMEPFLALYLLAGSSLLYAILRMGGPGKRRLFWACLSLLTLVFPKCLPLLFFDKPVFWLWLRESLLLGFFLRYLCYERDLHEGRIHHQRFFEHLGYILFIPQLLKLLNITPSQQWETSLETPRHLWPAAKMFLLGTAKILAYELSQVIPAGLQEGGAGSFVSAWYQIFTHYLLWFLWLSAHYDYAVAVARLLGVPVPANFHFPLLAASPRDFWRRWHVLHHRFLKEWIYQPLGGKERPLPAILGTFLASALLFSSLWVGSSSWLPSLSFATQWLPFFLIQALLVMAQALLFKNPGKRGIVSRAAGWLFTQGSFALCCLWLSGLSRFPRDTVPLETAAAVLRRAFFL